MDGPPVRRYQQSIDTAVRREAHERGLLAKALNLPEPRPLTLGAGHPEPARTNRHLCCHQHTLSLFEAIQTAHAELARLEALLHAIGGETWEAETADLEGQQACLGLLLDTIRAVVPSQLACAHDG